MCILHGPRWVASGTRNRGPTIAAEHLLFAVTKALRKRFAPIAGNTLFASELVSGKLGARTSLSAWKKEGDSRVLDVTLSVRKTRNAESDEVVRERSSTSLLNTCATHRLTAPNLHSLAQLNLDRTQFNR